MALPKCHFPHQDDPCLWSLEWSLRGQGIISTGLWIFRTPISIVWTTFAKHFVLLIVIFSFKMTLPCSQSHKLECMYFLFILYWNKISIRLLFCHLWWWPHLELILPPPGPHLRGGGVHQVKDKVKKQGTEIENPANDQHPYDVGFSDCS